MATVSSPNNGAGIVYNNGSGGGTVSNCYNAGEVSGTSANAGLGGICTENYGKITSCLNFGDVKNGSFVGGICAINYYSEQNIIESCYSDSNCSAMAIGKDNNSDATSNVYPKTTADLCEKLSSSFDSNIWTAGSSLPEGTGYLSNARLRTVTYTYPSLTDVTVTGTAHSTNGVQYNTGADGSTTWKSPTIITTPDELKAINDNSETLKGVYVLGNNIDLAKVENWTPIGTQSDPFTGIFDGNGKTIFNLTSTDDNGNYAGLFGVNDGTIRNVYLDMVNISTDGGCAAALCAVNNVGATIEGCAALSGGVKASNSADGNYGLAAGICSSNQGTINKCYNMAAVSTQYYGAGIVSQNSNGGTMSNCYNAGAVSGQSYNSYVGGICAEMRGNSSKIEYCLNFGEVKTASSSLHGAGILCMDRAGTVTNCYSDSDVCSADCVGNYGATATFVEKKTTAELCGPNFSFGSEWAAGKTTENGNNNPKFKTATYTYPSLTGVTKTLKSETRELYNFGTDSAPNWLKYTLITSADGLEAVKDNLSGYYVLDNGIDLTGEDWTPIGTRDDPFTGIFDGNGKTISNLTSTGDNGNYAGLFGANSGTIRNVYLDEVNISSTDGAAAGLCVVNKGTIEGCAVLSGSVEASDADGGQDYAAGICQNNFGKITKCYNMAAVSTKYFGAGIVSQNSNGGTVSNCYNAGAVSAKSGGIQESYIAGICASNYEIIENCLNFGEVKNSDNRGGILVYNNGTVINCYSDSDVCSADCVYYYFGTKTNVAKKTTAQLCNSEFWTTAGFGSEWAAGKTEEKSDASNTKFKTVTYTYPSLKDVTKTAVLGTRDLYNFGTGSDEDWQKYTLITDSKGLEAINENLEGNYVLGDNIDLKNIEWTPIGSNSRGFEGKFSGNGHTITINVVNPYDEGAGLFYQNNDLIMNLAVKGNVEGNGSSSDAAGICITNYGTIYGCSFEGTVTAYRYAGGICGTNDANGTISSCYAIATITSPGNYGAAGGIAGKTVPGSTTKGCYFAGTVDSTGSHFGPIFGYKKNNGKVERCFYDKELCNNSDANGDLTTAQLCSTTPSSAFEAGSFSTTDDLNNTRMRTVNYSYPRLKEGCAAYTFNGKQYNFSIDDTDDWQEFTEVRTADDLKKIIDNLSGNYVLMNDIDLKGEDIIIGTVHSLFTGKFSGDGHTISGLNLDTNENYIGLFCSVKRGLIMNLAVEGNVKGSNYVGIICGFNDGGTIINCYAIGSVEASDMVGGICGSGARYSSYPSTIKNCYFSGTIKVSEEKGKDAIGFKVQNVENCYYNSDLYTYEGSSGKGMSTFELTSSDALTEMGFTDSIWTKKANEITDANGKNGVACFPSFKSSEYVPSVDFSADITFERTDNKKLAFLDTFEVKYGVKIAFTNGDSTALVDVTNCTLAVEPNGVTLNPATDTFITVVRKVGKSTYSLKCTPKGAAESFLPTDGLTKSFDIDAVKKTLTAEDFTVTTPKDLTYNGKPKTVTVAFDDTISLQSGDYGDITVKYFDSDGKQVEQAINAGEYTVKIDVAEGKNCKAATNITADTWKFTIGKAIYSKAGTTTNVEYGWETRGEQSVAVEVPTDMGTYKENVQAEDQSGILSSLSKPKYEDGKVYFTFNDNTDDKIHAKATIHVNITCQNYNDFDVIVTVELNALKNRKPISSDDFDIVQTSNGSDITVEIKITNDKLDNIEDIRCSFDGETWENLDTDYAKRSAQHGQQITGYIKYIETSTHNASTPVSKQITTAHGDLSATYHEGIAATCTEDGSIEYWECTQCKKYFSDAAGTKEQASVVIPAGHSLTHIARVEATRTKKGNIEYWRCSECGKLFADVNAVQELTYAEIIIPASGRNKVDPTNDSAGNTDDTVCIGFGEIITQGTAIPPIDNGYKPSVPTPSKATTTTTTTTEPYIVGENGKIGKIGWDAILNTINSADDGNTIIIDMNGTTELPKTILEGIAGSDITLVLDMGDGFEWEINGNDVTAPRDVDMGVSKGANIPVKVINAVTGEYGYVTITLEHDGEFGFKAVLRVDLGKDSKGLFANLYYYLGKNKTAFIDSGKIGSDGKAELEFTHASEYVIVIDDYDHTAKSTNDTGDEVIVVPSDSEDANPAIGVTLSLVAILMLIAGAAAAVLSKKRK